MTKLEELKEFMAQATNVEDWNNRREILKKKCETKLINQLDASGFIKETLKGE